MGKENCVEGRLAFCAGVIAFLNCVRLFADDCTFALKESFDTGWIIKTGEAILQYGVPASDLFSWTFPERQFVAYQWLFEVAAALVFNCGGLWAVGLVACLLAGMLYFYVLPTMWHQKNIPLAIPFLFLSLVLTPHWFNARPQLISYFLLLLFVSILEKFRTSGRAEQIWFLPVLAVLWVNTHSFWCIGLLLICVYLAVDIHSRCLTKRTLLSPLLAVAGASVCAVLVNPYGSDLVSYIYTFFNGSQYLEMYEVYPSITSPQAVFVLSFFAAALILMIRKRSSVPIQGWIITICAVVAALAVRRYQSVAVLLIWPYLGLALQSVDWRRWKGKVDLSLQDKLCHGHRKLLSSFCGICAVVVSAACWYYHHPSEAEACNVYFEQSQELLQLAGNYIKKEDRLFNDATTGDWLILLNHAPVYIDTRYDMYPKQFCHNSFACMYGAPGSLEYIEKSGITHILVRDDFSPVGKLLQASENWTLIADNGHLSLWGHAAQDDLRLEEHRLTDNAIRSSNLSDNLVYYTIQRRCGKYVTMAQNMIAQKRNKEGVDCLVKALKLLPSSRILQTELTKARMRSLASLH